MNEYFSKFKRKRQRMRIIKSLLLGGAVGSVVGGIFLLLCKLAIIPVSPLIALPIGVGTFLLCGGVVYALLRTTNEQLAKELDTRFGLYEKVQTMVEYQNDAGALVDLQRQDAEQTLSQIPTAKFKTKNLWAYITALCVGVATLVPGFIVKAPQEEEPTIPFQISAVQVAGITELISYVGDSSMENPYKSDISAELIALLGELQTVNTVDGMQAALTESLTNIQTATFDSSSSTEILNALWKTQDAYAQALAKTLDTSALSQTDWGDYVEKMTAYQQSFAVQDPENASPIPDDEKRQTLLWNLQNTATKIELALTSSGIAETDGLYAVLQRLVSENTGNVSGAHIFGFSVIAQAPSILTYQDGLDELKNTFDSIINDVYAVTSQLKTNANVGEYTMTKLSALFAMDVPAFERPDFFTSSGENTNAGDDDDGGPNDGGIGEGAVYGSNDLVLDPLTGNYVEYGTLLDKYYAVMYDKLDNGEYTEEQKTIIRNYFALLYSGIEKQEGN